MNTATVLEARYRRLLALYPAEHRRRHQDEMLGVLMTGARTGQRWPGLRDTTDLIRGTLLIRLRPPRGEAVRQGWADALAVTSVVVPLAAFAYLVTPRLAALVTTPPRAVALIATLESFGVISAAWLILSALVLLRLRRLAGLVAAGLVVCLAIAFSLAGGWYDAPDLLNLLVPLALAATALLASPGPRRGMQLMNWKRYAVALVIPGGLAAVLHWVWPHEPPAADVLMITTCVVTLGGMMLASPLGRRVATLLAFPVYYLTMELLVLPSPIGNLSGTMSGWAGPLRITLTVLPFAVLALMAVLRAARRTPGHQGT